MNNYVQCQNCQYYLSGTCAYYEQPLDHYPDEDITCTDYAPKPLEKGIDMSMKKSLCEHCYYKNDCPVDPNYKAERAPTIITTCTDYEPAQDCDTHCIDCNFYDDCESPIKLDEQTMDFWLNERDYEPPYREPWGNDDCDVPYVNYVQEPEPDDDYYEQGTQSVLIDEFTEALLDWLETPKSK